MGYGIGQLLVATRAVGATPVAFLGAPNKTDKLIAHRFDDVTLKLPTEKALAVLDPARVQVVAVSPSCQSWTKDGAAQESHLLGCELLRVIRKLAPVVVVIVRDVGHFKIAGSELDAHLNELSYRRSTAEAGDGSEADRSVDVADNLDLKGGFAQCRDVFHYEQSQRLARLGPPPQLSADLLNPKWLRELLDPLESVPSHTWIGAGRFSPTPRALCREGGPVGRLTLGSSGEPPGMASRVHFAQRGDARPWIVARLLEGKLLLHLEAGGHTTTITCGQPLDELLHVTREIPVYGINGRAPGLRVSAACPLGPVNALILDDRAEPGTRRFRCLTEPELMRLVDIPVSERLEVSIPRHRPRQHLWAGAIPEEIARAAIQRAVSRVVAGSVLAEAPSAAAAGAEEHLFPTGTSSVTAAPQAGSQLLSTRARGGPSKRVERSNANLTLEEAVTHVLSSSIHLSSRNTYSSQFAHFFRFCTALGIDCFMRGLDPVAAQEVLVQFIAFKGVDQGYAHATVRVMLFAIHHFHLLNRCPDPLFGAPLCKVALKGLRNLQGGSVQKVAATPDLLIEALNELNLDVWGARPLRHVCLLVT